MVSVDVEGAKMDPGDPQEEVKNSSGLVFQRIKSGISWFFGGGDRAKSGTDDVFQTDWLVETDNKALSSAPKAIKLESLLMRLENKYAPVEDDEFIDQLWFNHGFLPQMETRMFLRRGGAFLVRKFNYSESEGGKDDLVISVAVPLEYTRTESDDKDENYGRDEPVFIQDYIVSKDGRSKETEIFIDDKMCFENFQDLLAYYIFNPNKESLNIKLFYPAPNRYFQYRQNALKRVETLATGELKEVYIADLEQFGSVEDAKVAVKQVKKDSPNTYDLNEKLIEEARMLLCLDHEHILICHGWQIHKMPFQFIFEYMEGGTLLQFLLTNFDTTSNKRLLQLSLEAARGLQYLHEKRVIHRNICAENCLLSKNGTLRIAGFSLAYRGHAYYMKAPEKLQTRYLAPENLTIFIFISQSDVYSFGNLIYEIFTGGLMPYNDSSVTTAKQKIVRGDVNDMGQSRAPKELGTFVEDHLWEYAIKERIDMEEVVEFLRKMYRSHEKDERSAKKNKSGNKSTATEETEPTKEGPSPGPRRKRSQMQVLDELVPEEDPLLEL